MAKMEKISTYKARALPVDAQEILVPKGFSPKSPHTLKPRLNLVPKKHLRHIISCAMVGGDIVAISLAFAFASILRHGELKPEQLVPVLSALLPIYLAIALNKGGYGPQATNAFGYSFRKATLAFLFATGSLLLIAFFMKVSATFSRAMLGVGTATGMVTLAMCRAAATKIGYGLLGKDPFAKVIIVDGIAPEERLTISIDAREAGINPDPSDRQSVSRLGNLTENADHVIVYCQRADRQRWAFALKSLNLHAEIIVPELARLSPLALSSHEGQPSLLLSSDPLGFGERLTKRAFDILLVFMALPLLLPVLLLSAIAIRIESKGPIMFRQERIGIANRAFTIWKFRSMRFESSDAIGDRSASRNDDRITRVGAFIRRTSIDELPQLWNVLKGEMSLVGPRPHATGSRAEEQLFWDIDDRYWHRHSVKPGLTGLAQIRGYRGATQATVDVTNRLQADLEYVANWSMIGDLKILMQTFGVISHKNAY
jgi:polysaccharide biosynthesis protein PslA